MAKAHNLFVGGESTTNQNSAMFPAKPANVSLAAHKQGGASVLERCLDFKAKGALTHYQQNTVFATGDIIQAILIPKHSMIELVTVQVLNPSAAGLTGSFKITSLDGGAIAYDVAGAVADGAVAIGAAPLALDVVSGKLMFVPSAANALTNVNKMTFSAAGFIATGADSQYLQVKLAGVPAGGNLGPLILDIGIVLRDFDRYGWR